MTVLNFPASPTTGDTYTENNVTYTWNGSYWDANNTGSLDNIYVEVAGDSMTGNLLLPGGGGDTAALQKQEIELLIDAAGGGGTGPADLYWERDAGALSPKVSTDNVDIGDGNILLDADGLINAKVSVSAENGGSNASLFAEGQMWTTHNLLDTDLVITTKKTGGREHFAVYGDGGVGIGPDVANLSTNKITLNAADGSINGPTVKDEFGNDIQTYTIFTSETAGLQRGEFSSFTNLFEPLFTPGSLSSSFRHRSKLADGTEISRFRVGTDGSIYNYDEKGDYVRALLSDGQTLVKGDIKIGGLLPGAPAITLNAADGNISADGVIGSGDFGSAIGKEGGYVWKGNGNGSQLSVYSNNDNKGAIFVYSAPDALTEKTLKFNVLNDGELHIGNDTANSHIPGNRNICLYNDGSGDFSGYLKVDGDVKIGTTGSFTPSTPAILLSAADGNIVADGNITAVGTNHEFGDFGQTSDEILQIKGAGASFRIGYDSSGAHQIKAAVGSSPKNLTFNVEGGSQDGGGFKFISDAAETRITKGGDVQIGGTLPAAPNITLNAADGTSRFAGSMVIGDDAVKLSTFGQVNAKQLVGADGKLEKEKLACLLGQITVKPDTYSYGYYMLYEGTEACRHIFGPNFDSVGGHSFQLGIGGTDSDRYKLSLNGDGTATFIDNAIRLGIHPSNDNAKISISPKNTSDANHSFGTYDEANGVFLNRLNNDGSAQFLSWNSTTDAVGFNIHKVDGIIYKSAKANSTEPAFRVYSGAATDTDNNTLTISNDGAIKTKANVYADGLICVGNNTKNAAIIQLKTAKCNYEWYMTDTNNMLGLYNRTDSTYRFAINYTGSVLIGSQVTSSAGTKITLNPSGTASFAGTVTATVVPPSDARFKENVTPAKPQLADVVALGGLLKNYDWNDQAPLNEEIRSQRQLGLIAQEAAEVCPAIVKDIHHTKTVEVTPAVTGPKGRVITEAVTQEVDDSYKGISTDALIMKLIGAVAELKAELDALKGA